MISELRSIFTLMAAESEPTEKFIRDTILLELSDFINTPLAKAIVILKASGIDSGEIEKLFDLTPTAQNVLCSANDELTKLYDDYDVLTKTDDKELISRMATAAIKYKWRLLNDDSIKPELKNMVATEILDRAMGKAKQTIETFNYNTDASSRLSKIDNAIVDFLGQIGLSETDARKVLDDGTIDV